MAQTTNRLFDEVGRLMNDAAGVATGVRREFDTMMRTQAERILRDLDVVHREEFEAVKEMARLAREENETLKVRIAALEAKLGVHPAGEGGEYETLVLDAPCYQKRIEVVRSTKEWRRDGGTWRVDEARLAAKP